MEENLKAHLYYDLVESHRRNVELLVKEIMTLSSNTGKFKDIDKDIKALIKEEIELLKISSASFDEIVKSIK